MSSEQCCLILDDDEHTLATKLTTKFTHTREQVVSKILIYQSRLVKEFKYYCNQIYSNEFVKRHMGKFTFPDNLIAYMNDIIAPGKKFLYKVGDEPFFNVTEYLYDHVHPDDYSKVLGWNGHYQLNGYRCGRDPVFDSDAFRKYVGPYSEKSYEIAIRLIDNYPMALRSFGISIFNYNSAIRLFLKHLKYFYLLKNTPSAFSSIEKVYEIKQFVEENMEEISSLLAACESFLHKYSDSVDIFLQLIYSYENEQPFERIRLNFLKSFQFPNVLFPKSFLWGDYENEEKSDLILMDDFIFIFESKRENYVYVEDVEVEYLEKVFKAKLVLCRIFS